MDSLKALLAVVAMPVYRVQQKLPDHVETKALLDYAFRTLVIMMAAGVGYIFSALTRIERADDEIENRLTRIEANRFTATDGQAIWIELNKKANQNEIPPAWHLRDLQDLTVRVDRLEGR